ncbi:MAG: glycosyltransferase family 4 protein, partial [Lacunisphaera sp.]
MTKPRVIFINRVYWPSLAATSQLLTDLAEGLAARGWPVHVIAAGHEPGPHHGVIIHRTGEGDRHGGLISRARNYIRFISQVRRELETLVQPGDRVVIMTDPPLLGAAVTSVAVKRGAQVIHWTQDIYPEIAAAHFGALAGALLFPLRARRDDAWRAASRCVVLGETMAGTVKRHGVAADRVLTIPNWAPRELHAPASNDERDAQRNMWGFADKFIVAYSGNLGRVHEFKAILRAAELLRDRPDIVFLFLGAGARLVEVRSLAATKRLNNVSILPPAPREKLAASLAGADVQLVTLNPVFAPLVYPSKLAGVLAASRPTIFV